MIIALADKLYIQGRGQRDFAIVTANQILDGLGTVGTNHADILDKLRLKSPHSIIALLGVQLLVY